ncbi:MAG: MCP four helix bundle domain-containing protein [Planctomycetota bacterium]|jgi:hypothetical protein
MNDKEAEKTPLAVSKSFLTVGPTLHYSHDNVQRCWLLAFAVFCISSSFWSKIVTGEFWSFNAQALRSAEFWRLDQSILTGVSIFEYPWQIFVLGLLMGVLAVVPVLISQLLSFGHSLPFILAVFFLADLPAFAICVLIGCFAAACRPLRFRSRFTAIALCTAPQLLYWGHCGGARGVEPIKWGFSFAPWICAWIIGLGIAGLVLGIGHYTRYRPGLVWIITTVFILLAVFTFEIRIGFDELDYQLYVANNNPEDITEFHDHSITEALDETIKNPVVRQYLAGFFYPTEPIPLRKELKREIQSQLRQGRWPSWFIRPAALNYQDKKQWLLEQYQTFIDRRPASRRMPIALYYKALLNEYSPDIDTIGQKEVLHFYSDYPFEESKRTWWRLHQDFGKSPESIEARWRIAKHLAAQARFGEADKHLAEAQAMALERSKLPAEQETGDDTFLGPFRPPADSVMTKVKIEHLQRRLNQLRNLIASKNLTDESASAERLARFVMLNPHAADYERRLDELLEQTGDSDPLRDNVLLAKTKLLADEQMRAEKLEQLHKQHQSADGGMHALYELGLLKIGLYQSETDPEQKKQYLGDARKTLTRFIRLYPDSFCVEQVKKNLEDLPPAD